MIKNKKMAGIKFGALLAGMTLLVGCDSVTGDSENGNSEEIEQNVASDYPSKPIEIIVPYSAGGGGDTVARILADALSSELDNQVNVINREGAGGEVGISEIARKDSDGYTLGVFGYPDNFILEKTRDTDFSFDSFEYLGAFDDMPMGIFAGPNNDYDNIDDLKAFADSNPGSVTIGESGALGLLHALALSERLELDSTPVTYAGGGELMNALLGNHVSLGSTSSMSHDPINDGGGEAIGFAAAERMEMFPDVPTFKELGYDLEMGVSRVLVAPEGLPEDVRDILVEAINTIGSDQELKDSFENAALPYRYLSHDEIGEFLDDSNATLEPIIQNNIDRFKE